MVTSGALAVLDKPQLAAVLAHERAHLAGRPALVAALLAIATGTAVPVAAPVTRAVPPGALAASGHAVPARVERLLDPPGPAAAALFGLALALASAAFILVPGLLAAAA